MAGSSKDVELVIRARDAASKTVESIVAALNNLKTAQAGVAAGAGQTSNLIGQLATEYGNLERQIEGLQGFGKVAQQMDKAAQAVDRLDAAVQRATQEQSRLQAAQERAAVASAGAARALEAAKANLDAQKGALAALGKGVDKTSAAYREHKAAVEAATIAQKEARAAANATATEQRRIDGAVQESVAALDAQQSALAGARTEYQQIAVAAGRASSALGGVEASQEAVSAAARKARADLDQVGQALVRQRSAQAAPTAVVSGGAAANATAAYRAQVQAVQEAGAAYNQARAEATRLGKEVAAAVQPSRELQTAFLLAREGAEAAKGAYLNQAAALSQLKGVARGSFGVFETLANEIHALPGSVDRVGAAISSSARKAAADIDGIREALARSTTAVAAPPAAQTGAAAQATAGYRAQAEAVRSAGAAYEAARAEATRLGKEIATAAAPTQELRDAFIQAREASQSAKTAYLEQAEALNKLKGVARGSFGVFESVATSIHALPDSVGRVGAAVKQGAQLVQQSNKPTGRKGEVLFGLRPYELQNLSFQINDLITQIASGTSPSQAFAQQFGQIVQIFPRLGAVLIPILPELVGLAAAFAVVGAAVAQVTDKEASVRQFGASLAASADGARHNADIMADAAHSLDVFGTSLKIAREEIGIFTAAGISDAALVAFGQAAENVSRVTGIKIPDAAKKMADGFTRGFDAVADLNKAFNFLTPAEYDQIKAMFDSGHAAEARTLAFEKFSGVMDKAAAQARGPWSEAIRNLTQAWDNFLHFLGNTAVVQAAINILGALAKAARDATAALPGARGAGAGAGGGNPQIDSEIQKLRELQAERKRAGSVAGFAERTVRRAAGDAARAIIPGGQLLPPASGGRTTADIDREIAVTQTRLNQLRKDQAQIVQDGTAAQINAGKPVLQQLQDQLDSLKGVNDQRRIAIAGEKAYNQALAVGADKASQDRARQLGEQIERTQVAKEREAEARSAASRQRASESRAAALQNRLNSMEGQLAGAENALAGKVAEGQVASLDSRLAVISADALKIKTELAKFQKAGGTDVNGESLKDFEARVDANTTILKQQATLKFYAESLAELDKQRDERLKSIADRFADGKISAAQAFSEEAAANAELQQQIAATAAVAEEFAKSIRGAKPDPKLEAFIAKMDTLRTSPATGTKSPSAKGGLELLGAQDRDLNAVLSERNSIIETNNNLLHEGVITLGEWRSRVQGAYAETTPEVEKQIAAIRQLLDLLKEQGAITGQTYDAWIAKLQLVQSQTANLTTQVLSVSDANNMLADSGVGFFEKFTQSIANGQNVVQAFGQAFLSTVADILLQIGELILKQELLNLVMQSGVGKGLAGGVNGLFNSATATASAAPLIAASGALSGSAGALAGSAAPLMAAAGQLMAAAQMLAVANATSAAGVFHAGGVVGSANRTRLVNPAIFAAARRYHVGGIAGLAPGEVPTILQRGEEVLRRNDPRHILNGAGGSPAAGASGPMTIRNVLLMDPSQVESALASPGGERVILSVLKKNSGTVKAMVRE